MADLFGRSTPIKVISLWQPWASLMAAGVKLHETRHWPTAYRGPLAIHAAKTVDVAGAPEQLCLDVLGRWWAKEVPTGAVLAIGELTRCSEAHTVADHLLVADLESGNFARGRFAWRIEKMRRLAQPRPLVGRQGLFNWDLPEDIEPLLGPPINHAAACAAIGWGASRVQPPTSLS